MRRKRNPYVQKGNKIASFSARYWDTFTKNSTMLKNFKIDLQNKPRKIVVVRRAEGLSLICWLQKYIHYQAITSF